MSAHLVAARELSDIESATPCKRLSKALVTQVLPSAWGVASIQYVRQLLGHLHEADSWDRIIRGFEGWSSTSRLSTEAQPAAMVPIRHSILAKRHPTCILVGSAGSDMRLGLLQYLNCQYYHPCVINPPSLEQQAALSACTSKQLELVGSMVGRSSDLAI